MKLIVYKVRVKEGRVAAFRELADNTLIPEARKLSGCQLFSVYQNIEDAGEFVFHEVWDESNSVHTYKQNLIAALGQPHPGEEFPATMNDMIESDEDIV